MSAHKASPPFSIACAAMKPSDRHNLAKVGVRQRLGSNQPPARPVRIRPCVSTYLSTARVWLAETW